MTQWTVHLSVCWWYWQRVQHLCQQFFILGFSCILAWYCWHHVVASKCLLRHMCKGTARVITTSPGRVSVVTLTLSLRRLNSSSLFPSSGRNWCQFPGVLPSTAICIPVPIFLLMAALRLASLYWSPNTTSTRWTDFTKWLIYILREWIGPDRFKQLLQLLLIENNYVHFRH